MQDSRNLILAITLSLAVLIGWHYFYEAPRLEAQRQQQALKAEMEAAKTAADLAAKGTPDDPSLPRPAGDAALPDTAAKVIAEAPRIQITTPSLHGSLSLRGGRIDDLKLAKYRETVDPASPEIVLLAPAGTPKPYFAEFGWAQDRPEPGKVPGPDTLWSQIGGSSLSPGSPVTLAWTNPDGLTFERRIEVDENYLFTITDTVINKSSTATTLYSYGRIRRDSTPRTEGNYLLHEGLLGVLGGTLREVNYADIAKEQRQIAKDLTGGWLGITDKYWLTALIPDQKAGLEASFLYLPQDDAYLATFLRKGETVEPGKSATVTNSLYAGAKVVQVIDATAEKLSVQLFDRAIDWGWFYFLTKPMFHLIEFFYRIVGNFGIAILLLTVVIKAAFFPLANKSYISMSKMKQIQPQLQKLQEIYKDDRVKLQQEMMDLYKREKVNPVSGCLPILLQIPVFFALYKMLFVTIEMRHAPFYGWIKDLSAADPTTIFNLFGLIPWTPPAFLMLGVWPILMGITMWLQQKLQPAALDPIQQRIFSLMPIIFTFTLTGFPAGLVIYWTWNNLLSILQQWVIMRRMGVKVNLTGSDTQAS